MNSLTDSISRDGLLQPILLRPVGDRYEVVCGTRRLLALRALDKTEILCTVEEMDRQRAMKLAFSENNERVNLSPVDEAVYFGQMLGVTEQQVFGLATPGHPEVSKGLPTHKNAKVQKLVRELGISAKRIEDRLPLLALPPELARLVGRRERTVEEKRKESLLIAFPVLELLSTEALDIISERFWKTVEDE